MDHGDKQILEVAEDYLDGEAFDVLAAPARSLVAIGAAASLNCHACLRHLIPVALNNGILAEEVTAALAVAREIRARAGGLTDEYVTALVQRGAVTLASRVGPTDCC